MGDRVFCAADSEELKNYGIKVGLTNYAAAYCTGLLVARRLLKQLKLDSQFVGLESATGDEYHIEENSTDRRPFKCLLDVGIVKTTKGNRVFGAMKGACDGGLHIPHSSKRFPGFSSEADGDGGEDGGRYNAEEHRARILGLHVAQYMREMQEENPEKFEAHFSRYLRCGVGADDIEAMYTNAHRLIRENPDRRPRPERAAPPVRVRMGDIIKTSTASYIRRRKLSAQQRKQRVRRKLKIITDMVQASAPGD